MGLYVNKENVIALVGEEELIKQGFDLETFRHEYHSIPKNDQERKLVKVLSEAATLAAVERHAGQVRYVYGPTGRSTLAQGKDLSNVKFVIGTGGALTRLENGPDILRKIPKDKESKSALLLPTGTVKILIDHDYIMASLGVLAFKYEEAALTLLEKSFGEKVFES